MSFPTVNQWLYATGGILVGGLVTKYIGFHRNRNSGIMKQFFKAWLYFEGGVAVSAVSTAILKLSNTSHYIGKLPKLAMVVSIFGLIKFFPTISSDEENRPSFKNITSCLVYWSMPSIYYSTFKYSTLQYSFLYSIHLFTMCFTVGTTLPLKHHLLPDFGLKTTISGVILLTASFLCYLIVRMPGLYMNASLIITILGILIDDLQHLKQKYGSSSEDETVIFNPLKTSIPIFMEAALMFGVLSIIIEEL